MDAQGTEWITAESIDIRAQHRSPLDEALDEIDHALNRMRVLHDDLGGRLVSILRPGWSERAEPSDSPEVAQRPSELVHTLRARAAQIRGENDGLQYLLDGLDL